MIETNLRAAILILRRLNSELNEIKVRYVNLEGEYIRLRDRLFHRFGDRECNHCDEWTDPREMTTCNKCYFRVCQDCFAYCLMGDIGRETCRHSCPPETKRDATILSDKKTIMPMVDVKTKIWGQNTSGNKRLQVAIFLINRLFGKIKVYEQSHFELDQKHLKTLIRLVIWYQDCAKCGEWTSSEEIPDHYYCDLCLSTLKNN